VLEADLGEVGVLGAPAEATGTRGEVLSDRAEGGGAHGRQGAEAGGGKPWGLSMFSAPYLHCPAGPERLGDIRLGHGALSIPLPASPLRPLPALEFSVVSRIGSALPPSLWGGSSRMSLLRSARSCAQARGAGPGSRLTPMGGRAAAPGGRGDRREPDSGRGRPAPGRNVRLEEVVRDLIAQVCDLPYPVELRLVQVPARQGCLDFRRDGHLVGAEIVLCTLRDHNPETPASPRAAL
jgi:hypothetical protein